MALFQSVAAFTVLCLMIASAWDPLNCPTSGAPFEPSCASEALPADAAVTLFFQSTEYTGYFDCSSASVTYCARNWTQPLSSTVGSCYFLLPAGETYTCTSSKEDSNVDVLEASYTLLASGVMAAVPPRTLSCPSGKLTGSCIEPAAGKDAWVFLSWTGVADAGDESLFTCSAGDTVLCEWSSTVLGAADSSSCSFLLPGSTPLVCTVSNGAIDFGVATRATDLALAPYSTTAIKAPWQACPIVEEHDPRGCTCSFESPSNETDTVVTLISQSNSYGPTFNSFSCEYGGAIVCGWGSSSYVDDSLPTGSCTFVLPPGGSYTCRMDWGVVYFTFTAVNSTRGTMFLPASASFSGSDHSRHLGAAAPVKAGAELMRLQSLFTQWKSEHSVNFTSPHESAAAFANFEAHVAMLEDALQRGRIVDVPNLDDQGRPTRFNRFAAMSLTDWKSAYGSGARFASPAKCQSNSTVASPLPPPAAWDWRTRGVVTPVKYQGHCGGCWAFSTTGSVESAMAIIPDHGLVSLSEQQLISCDNTNSGCAGGYADAAMNWLASNGAATEASYPFVSSGGDAPRCTNTGYVKAVVNVTGCAYVPGDSSEEIEETLASWLAAYGPMSIYVAAMNPLWSTYTGGVMTGCCFKTSIDHAVLVVGYGSTANGLAYWIVKNSWSESWGEVGYVRLARGSNQCGLANVFEPPMLPLVSGGAYSPASASPTQPAIASGSSSSGIDVAGIVALSVCGSVVVVAIVVVVTWWAMVRFGKTPGLMPATGMSYSYQTLGDGSPTKV